MTTLTATFTDYSYNSEARLKKDRWSTVVVEDQLYPVSVKFNREERTLYVRRKDIESAGDRSNATAMLRTETGEAAFGFWQHGYTGSATHREILEVWVQGRRLIEICNYQNGRKKDSKKYLKSINA